MPGLSNQNFSSTPGVWLRLSNADVAEPLVRKLMGARHPVRREREGLLVGDALAFRHKLALPNASDLTALERMTLRGLNAVAEEVTKENLE